MESKKIVNMTKDRTVSIARNIEKYINRSIQEQIMEINVPIFTILKKHLALDTYFLNYIDLKAIMGDNVRLLDRMVLQSINSFITEQVYTAIKEKPGMVGVWDKYTIFSIASTVTTIFKHDEKEEQYFSALPYVVINEEDLQTLPEGSYMPFSEYNPNRFTQILSQIQTKVIDTIADLMSNAIPNIFLNSGNKSEDLVLRLVESFKTNCEQAEIHLSEDFLKSTVNEKNIVDFVHEIETPFFSTIVAFMHNSGISDNLIKLFLSSRLMILFDDPVESKNKKMKDINLSFVMRYQDVDNRFEPISASVSYPIGELYSILMDYENMSKSAKVRFGKMLRKAILTYNVMALDIYFALMTSNKKTMEEVFINTEESKKEVEVDTEEVNDLLDSIE